MVDKNVPEAPTNVESLVNSLSPLTVTIADGVATVVKKVHPKVTNADIIPKAQTVGDAIQVSIDLTGCPGIIAILLDMDAALPGLQDTATVKGGASKTGVAQFAFDPVQIATVSALSPARCTAIVSATVAGNAEPDSTNNTTKLVIDVVDKNDF